MIYAQTPKFSIDGDSCTDPAAATTTAPTCAAAATVTQTVTVRGNSSTAAGAASSAAAAVATSTFQGACPSTIGWSGNYSHPVTLTSTPHAGRGVATATATATATSAAAALTTGTDAVPTLASSGAHYWNTTVVVVPTTATVATEAAPSGDLTGVERVKTKTCSKKRQARKRHSDGGRRSPFPRR